VLTLVDVFLLVEVVLLVLLVEGFELDSLLLLVLLVLELFEVIK